MKTIAWALTALLMTSLAHANEKTFHDFTVDTISGETFDLSQYKGKVVLVVNVASRCGFTKQYANLVALSDRYADKDLVVAGFPANNFGGQEPGSNAEIMEFCSTKFDVDFPMFAKVSVKGDDQHELFAWLTSAPNPDFTGGIRWNFEKILVGKDGTVLRRFRSNVKPDAPKVTEAIDAALAASGT